MKRKSIPILILAFFAFIGNCFSQNNPMVVFTYDSNGNRTSLNYILTRVLDDGITEDTINNNKEVVSPMDVAISVYPNPVTDYLVVATTAYDQNQVISIKVYSVNGYMIEEKVTSSDRTEFNLSNYPAGIYFLSVICDEERQLWKIIKK